MRALTGLSVAAVIAVTVAAKQTTAIIAPEDAAKHVGETVQVQGLVANVKIAAHDSTVYIDFGAAYPNQVFTAMIAPTARKSFPNVERLTGKTVIVKGKVTLYKGKPEIRLTQSSQLEVVV